MFDLPHELRRQQDHGQYNPAAGPTRQVATPGQTPSQHPYGSPVPQNAPNPASMKSPEDWTFLQEFGDSHDPFYELDVELRGLLDAGFNLDQIGVMS